MGCEEVTFGDRLNAFFDELPAAVLAYSLAVGAFALAAILFRAAVYLYLNV